jgi:hypothetical protein
MMNRRSLFKSLAIGLTVMALAVAQADTLNLALKLHPSTENVFVVANNPDERNVERFEPN